MRRKALPALLACALAGASSTLAAAVFWVDGAGSDEEACGAATLPCKSIQFALDRASPGDTIRVLPGTYRECVLAPFALHLVADAIEQDPPSREATVVDGWGVCGGFACEGNPALRCFRGEGCQAACQGGVCANDSETACEGDGDCDFGDCSALEREPRATIELAPGSSLEGFTVTGGGLGGVFAEGTATIERNVIEGNSGDYGGGVSVWPHSGGEERSEAPLLCFADASLSCAEASDCRVCENDPGRTCGSSAECGGGDCVELGPCLRVAEVFLSDNVIRDNVAERSGGGVFAFPSAEEGGGSRVVAEANTVADNLASGGDGGGIFVQTLAGDDGTVEARLADNTITGNEAVRVESLPSGSGGGVSVQSLVDGYFGRSSLILEGNTVEGNSAARGGGVRVESGAYFLLGEAIGSTHGDDRILIFANVISGNVAAEDGGGVSGWMGVSGEEGRQDFLLRENEVVENEAGRRGGGVDLLLENEGGFSTGEAGASLLALKNAISSNSAEGGGGISVWSRVTPEGNPWTVSCEISGNTIEGNEAAGYGGGALLVAEAMSNESVLRFDHNLLLSNSARDPEEGLGVGGAALLLATRSGELPSSSRAYLFADHNTVAFNAADSGAGGFEIESATEGGGAEVHVTNSVLEGNSGYGLGGPAPGDPGVLTWGGTGDLAVHVGYTTIHGSVSGSVERTLEPVLIAEGVVEEDPLLDASGVPGTCSPTIDGGDPSVDSSAEPQPNGGRVNQGHLGGTGDTVTSLPDPTGDRRVTGADLIEIAAAFGAEAGDLRWKDSLDLDRNAVIDGEDLAYVAAGWGADCR